MEWFSGATTVPNSVLAVAGGVAGFMALRAAARVTDELGVFHAQDSKPRGLRVVITGGSRGIGYALATRFAAMGDHVCIVGRDAKALEAAVASCKGRLSPVQADVTDAEDVTHMMMQCKIALGGEIDVVVHNAGAGQRANAELALTPVADITTVVRTNTLGTLLVAREAISTLGAQKHGGHLFLMDGAGATGMSTPSFASYGYTKAGTPQLLSSLRAECKGSGVVVHGLSPGMVMTSLLLKSPTRGALWMFNVLADMPSTVAAWMVPRIRGASALPVRRGSEAKAATYRKFLTPTSAVLRFLGVPLGLSKNRLVDTDSGVVKAPELGTPSAVTVKASPSAAAGTASKDE